VTTLDSLHLELRYLKYWSLITQNYGREYLNRDREYFEQAHYLIQSLIISQGYLKIRKCSIESHRFLSSVTDRSLLHHLQYLGNIQ